MSNKKKFNKDYSKEDGCATKSINETNSNNRNGRGRNSDHRPPRSSQRNDAAWYNTIPQMVKDAASISFAEAIGRPIPSNGVCVDDDGTEMSYLPDTIPGIMILGYVPGVGVSTDASSPINLTGAANYAFIRHANSGARNWTQNDGTLYLIGGANLYAFWATMARVLGLMNRYDIYNRYVGDRLIQALGFNPDDLRSHQSDLRSFLNQFAYKLGSICFPSQMSYIARQLQLAGNVYKDAAGVKAQLYAFVPDAFFKFNELGNEAGSALIPVPAHSIRTFADIVRVGTELIDSFLESESVMTISGDMKKAYEGNVLMVSTIGENYSFEFKDVEEISTQIMNYRSTGEFDVDYTYTNPVGDWTDVPAAWILADNATNIVYWNPVLNYGDTGLEYFMQGREENGNYLNMPQDAPAPDDVMVATRMQPVLTFKAAPDRVGNYAGVVTMGSELPTYARVWCIDREGRFTNTPVYTYVDASRNTTESDRILARTSTFKMHPLNIVVDGSGIEDADFHGPTFVGFHSDIRNMVYVPKTVYTKANEAALLSEFYNPNLGAFLKTN